MRVICTTTDYYVSGESKGGISVRRGSVYHITDIKDHQWICEHAWSKGVLGVPARGDWYELLELDGYHHESKFLEIPEDEIDNEIKEELYELETNYN